MISNHLNTMTANFDLLHKKYENFIIIGDFKSEMKEDPMNCRDIENTILETLNIHAPSKKGYIRAL